MAFVPCSDFARARAAGARNLHVFASLRDDPRFKKMFQRMKLPG